MNKPHTRWALFCDRLKRLRQTMLRNRHVQGFAVWLASLYLRFVFLTSKVTYQHDETTQPYFNGEAIGVFTFWHGRLLMAPFFKPKKHGLLVMSSHHNDAELMATLLKCFGIGTVRGGSSSGSLKAVRGIVKKVREGNHMAITPDGPRGPALVAKPGAAYLSRLLKAPIIPMATASTRQKTLHSWDRLQVALPFGHLVVCSGPALFISKDQDPDSEEARVAVEEALNRVTAQADAFVKKDR